MFKVNNKDINFERMSHLALVFLLLTLSRQISAGLDVGPGVLRLNTVLLQGFGYLIDIVVYLSDLDEFTTTNT